MMSIPANILGVLNDVNTTSKRQSVKLSISLDIARGLAALLVFCFHTANYFAQISPTLGALARYGYMGVPIFFVISGYCMAASSHQVLRHNRSASSFLRKRFLRIYPALWASIAVVVATPYILALLSSLKTGIYTAPTPRWLVLDSIEWLQFITLTRVFVDNGPGLDHAFSPLNTVYWTLAIEFQFYLVIYLALLWRKWFTLILAFVTTSSLAVFAFPDLKGTGLFLGFWPMFALGLGLYYLLDRRYTLDRLGRSFGKWLALAFLSISALVFAILALKGQLAQVLDGIFGDDLFGFAVCAAIAFWLLSATEQRVSSMAVSGHALVRYPLKLGVFLGTVSYSIYLLHPKLYQFPDMVMRQLTTPDNPIYLVAIFGGTITMSWVFYLFFERPFTSRRRA